MRSSERKAPGRFGDSASGFAMDGQMLHFRWEAGPGPGDAGSHGNLERRLSGNSSRPIESGDEEGGVALSWHRARAPGPGRDSEGLRVCTEAKGYCWGFELVPGGRLCASRALSDLKGMGPSHPFGPRLPRGGRHKVGGGGRPRP